MNENKFDFPTEVVDLPSKGLVYPEGHPLRKGNIEIKYMTAREEDIAPSQWYLFQPHPQCDTWQISPVQSMAL